MGHANAQVIIENSAATTLAVTEATTVEAITIAPTTVSETKEVKTYTQKETIVQEVQQTQVSVWQKIQKVIYIGQQYLWIKSNIKMLSTYFR